MQYNHTHHDLQHYQPDVDLPPDEVAGAGPPLALLAAIVAIVVLAIALMAWSPWDGGEPNRIPDNNQPAQSAPVQQQAPQSPAR